MSNIYIHRNCIYSQHNWVKALTMEDKYTTELSNKKAVLAQ